MKYMKLVVGLGNVGKEYQNTRHNVGFMVLDSFVHDFTLEKKFQAYIKKDCIDGVDVLFVKPTTFMNLSGIAVRKLVDYYKISIEDILVIQDDMDLPFGKYRCKIDSSSGGHNGIKSIISSLGTQNFARLKIGIAHDRSMDTKDYVLGTFSKQELNILKDQYSVYQNIILSFLSEGISKTMNLLNSK